jgi:pyridoxal phosphate enzyme (YggS family)
MATALLQSASSNGTVGLIAVSKGHPAAAIRSFYALGLRDFAENYAQELLAKADELQDLTDIRWHFIGKIQSNKAKKIAQVAQFIHGVDRLPLLSELAKGASVLHPLHVFLQIQVDEHDVNKSGCPYEQAQELCQALSQNPAIVWEGFMGMGPADASNDRLHFLYERFIQRAHQLWEKFAPRDPSRQARPMQVSLGMSEDLEIAIRCGATHIRIGSALFGPRPKKVKPPENAHP